MKGYVRVPRHLGKFNDVLRRWTINEVYIKIRLHFKKGTQKPRTWKETDFMGVSAVVVSNIDSVGGTLQAHFA